MDIGQLRIQRELTVVDSLADFLKNIVNTVDKNRSTLGYEIVNEPQVHSDDQWQKVGTFNTFITNALRQVTHKTIAYSRTNPLKPRMIRPLIYRPRTWQKSLQMIRAM